MRILETEGTNDLKDAIQQLLPWGLSRAYRVCMAQEGGFYMCAGGALWMSCPCWRALASGMRDALTLNTWAQCS